MSRISLLPVGAPAFFATITVPGRVLYVSRSIDEISTTSRHRETTDPAARAHYPFGWVSMFLSPPAGETLGNLVRDGGALQARGTDRCVAQ